MGLFDWQKNDDGTDDDTDDDQPGFGGLGGWRGKYDEPGSPDYDPDHGFDAGAALVELGGGHTRDTVPDATTPFATEGGGWTTKNLDAYLDGRFEDLKE
jgi:hypothetical protein